MPNDLLVSCVELLIVLDGLPIDHWSALHAYCSPEMRRLALAIKDTEDCTKAVEKVADDSVGSVERRGIL